MFARRNPLPYICSRCRYSTSIATKTKPLSIPSEGAAKLITRRLILVHGRDAAKFLQGMLTNAVRPESRAGMYAAILNAQGRVLHDVFVYPTNGSSWHKRVNGADADPGYLIEVDLEQANVLYLHLKRHRLNAKLNLRLLDYGEMDVWSVWKDGDRWTAHGESNPDEASGDISLTDCRAPGLGRRVLLPSEGFDRKLIEEVGEAPLEAYTVRRYLRGVPEGQREITPRTSLPMGFNIDVMGGIDFKKGCYVGQELTIRTHHTGVVRRRVLPFQFYERGTAPPASLEYNASYAVRLPEDEVDIRRDDEKQRFTGKILTSIGNVGLALCRLEEMTDLTVSAEASPFNPSELFFARDINRQEVGVKAFVPGWLRGRIREPKIQKRVG